MRGIDLGRPFAALHLLTDAEIFGWRRPEPRRPIRRRKVAPETYFADLVPGDFVVHVFSAAARELYRLEALWYDAPVIEP